MSARCDQRSQWASGRRRSPRRATERALSSQDKSLVPAAGTNAASPHSSRIRCVGASRMPRTAWSVPYGADETAFVVIDRLGRREGVEREIEVERTDIETIISELVAGQFNDPARVIAS